MSGRKSHFILLALILGLLVVVGLIAKPGSPLHKEATLGLDLQGGLQVVLEARPTSGQEPSTEDMERSVDIIRSRVDALGVGETEIRRQGPNQIVVDLPGIKDPKKALEVIGKTAQLEIYDMEPKLEQVSKDVNQQPQALGLHELLSQVQNEVNEKGASGYYAFDAKDKLLAGPEVSREALERALKNRLGRGLEQTDQVLAIPKGDVVVHCRGVTGCVGAPNARPGATWYYLFKHQPDITGRELDAGGISAQFGQDGQPSVTLAFRGKGSDAFHRITKRQYDDGQLFQNYQHSAITLDNELISTPIIDFKDATLSDGISGGAQINQITSIGEAKNLALVLQTGALPVRFEPQERTEISATLGQDSLDEAKRAAIIGLLLVAIFLIALYRLLGVVAVGALGIYAAFLYGVILALNVTLTLPGFAGMILTIGIAADANIVIFERTKEEFRGGKSVRAAIATGYSRGFHTIVDANVVTMITAGVLFIVATAGVKGFALMLMLGTLISLFTAVAGTRAILALLAGFGWFEHPWLMGARGEQKGRFLQIDFMKKRYLWLAISGVALAIGAFSLMTRGLNLGIDFEGGTQMTFATQQPTDLAKVRAVVQEVTGETSAQVVGRGASSGTSGSLYKSFQLRTRSLPQGEQDDLQSQLRQQVGAVKPGTKNVSASFGRQIAKDALLAILVSLLLIVGYISLRFDFKYSMPVIVALFHDILLTVGVYSLTFREVTTSTVAAVLTVLGYSIYDTIIIFDRVRENVPLMRSAPFAQIANVSLWETIRRSLATSFVTLLPVAALFFAGGDTLKDFAFALLVGVLAGAYSSIFIAAPLLTMWKEREPEFARRIDGGGGRPAAELDGEAEVEPAESFAAVGATVAGVPAAAEAPMSRPVPPAGDAEKQERRRQRRRSKPHGRPR